ncbi:MAG TPA: TetR/AcrR family transcriptional regulator, partial [Pinirhizobacter sp.]|uniref:TetR/AcrR family transcriptional regulator n=1 Tax=Pinirhizobacter sp. TaxID=2950432 RepID=UPI002C6E39A5
MPPLVHRKKPLQARSAITVAAIGEAAIEVLLAEGIERTTTTRVAARAGVSVGSLYQYFPDKHSLLAAVLAQHLTHVAMAVERSCTEHRGGKVVD